MPYLPIEILEVAASYCTRATLRSLRLACGKQHALYKIATAFLFEDLHLEHPSDWPTDDSGRHFWQTLVLPNVRTCHVRFHGRESTGGSDENPHDAFIASCSDSLAMMNGLQVLDFDISLNKKADPAAMQLLSSCLSATQLVGRNIKLKILFDFWGIGGILPMDHEKSCAYLSRTFLPLLAGVSRTNLDINLHRVDDLDAANASSALIPCYKLLHLPTDRFGDLPGSISRWLDVSFLRSLHIEWIGSNGLTVWPCLQAVAGALEYLWLESNAPVQHDGTVLTFPNLRSLVYTAHPEAFVDFLLVIRAPRADYLDFPYRQWDLDSAVLLYRVFPSLRRVRYDLRCSEYGRHRYCQPGLDAIRMFTFFSVWRSLENRIWAWLSGPPEEAAIATLQMTGLPVSTLNTYISNEWIASKVEPSRVVGRNFWNLEQYVITIDAAPGPILQTCLRSMLSLDAPNLQELMICMRDHDPSILLRELAPVVEGGRFPSLRTLRFTATLLQLEDKEVKDLVKHLRTSCERAGVDWSVEISPW